MKEDVIFLTADQIPDISQIKKGSIYGISGKFKYLKTKENWVLCDKDNFFISKIRIKGVQEKDLSGNSNKIITSQNGGDFLRFRSRSNEKRRTVFLRNL